MTIAYSSLCELARQLTHGHRQSKASLRPHSIMQLLLNRNGPGRRIPRAHQQKDSTLATSGLCVILRSSRILLRL